MEYLSESEQLPRKCVLVVVDGIVVGALSVTDPVKPEGGQVISFLKSMNILSIIVTGNNWATTAIANEVGIGVVFAETDPLGQADKINELQIMAALKQAFIDVINEQSKEAANRIMVAERKEIQFEEELSNILDMLVRIK